MPKHGKNLAKVYLVQGKKNEAIARYEAAIKARPDNGQAYLALGLLYEGDRDLKNAARVYEQALEQNPDFWFASNNLAFLICEQSPTADDLDKALGLAQYAQNLRPNDPAVLDTVGWIYYHKQDFIQARGYLERALAASPAAPVLNFHMGMVLYKTGHIDEAKAKLEKALEADENFYGRETAEATLKELG